MSLTGGACGTHRIDRVGTLVEVVVSREDEVDLVGAQDRLEHGAERVVRAVATRGVHRRVWRVVHEAHDEVDGACSAASNCGLRDTSVCVASCHPCPRLYLSGGV